MKLFINVIYAHILIYTHKYIVQDRQSNKKLVQLLSNCHDNLEP